MPPFFSVVIPLYNKEDYIDHTLNSVINQSFKDFEIIIVNDGSTDNSLDIVNKFTDLRIKVLNQENKGLSAARNAGIKMAIAPFIALLDADDLWVKDYLQTQYNLIQNHKNEKIFATNFTIWDKTTLPSLKNQIQNKTTSSLIENYFSLKKNLFTYSSIVFSISIFKELGGFNENINYGEEEEFSILCFNKYNLVYCSVSKVFYRIGMKNQLTAPNKNSTRIIPDYEIYLENSINQDLKKYIDFVHYKLVVLYKMERNNELVKFYKKKINPLNLSFKKQIKFYLPAWLFYNIKLVYIWFNKRFFHS